MKTLTIRRHAQRQKPGKHLSQTGIDLARMTRPQTSPFDLVVTANVPRAIETSIAFGNEVHQMDDALGQLPREIFDKIGWPNSFSHFKTIISQHKDVEDFANAQAQNWREIVDHLPKNGRALIISHGAIIELGLIACQPNANHKEWGNAIGYCEGANLTLEGNVITGEIFRVPDKHYQVLN